MTMMSVPSTTDRLSGEASTSMGKHLAGLRLAKRSSSLRRPSSPRSGFCSWGRWSHLGPPTAPKRMASLSSQSRSVEGGSGSPVASMAAPPMRACSNSKDTPVALPTTSSTRRASGVTSCPMPSPPRTAILCVATIGSPLRADLFLFGLLPRGRLDQPVERVHVGARARLDHVRRAALARHHGAVEIHPDRDLAKGVLARGDGSELVVLEPLLAPGGGVDGVEHGVHRSVADPRVLEHLRILLEPHGRRRDDAGPAD